MATSQSGVQLGAYVGNLNNADATEQAATTAQFNSLAAAMGQAPTLMDTYVDQSIPKDQWAGNSQWAADSWAATSWAKGMTPVVGLPMADSTQSGDAAFQAIAAGQYDSAILGVFQAWANDGYTSFYIRPGWEMNGAWYNWSVNPSDAADFVKAFQHIADLAHSFTGAKISVVWNPNQGDTSVPLSSLYPGDAYVDVVGLDTYGAPVGTSSSPTDTSTSSSSITLEDVLALAKAHNKPFALPETGGLDATFAQQLGSVIAGSGDQVAFVNLWDIDDVSGNLSWSNASDNQSAVAAAWKQAFATISAANGASGHGSTAPVTTAPPTTTGSTTPTTTKAGSPTTPTSTTPTGTTTTAGTTGTTAAATSLSPQDLSVAVPASISAMSGKSSAVSGVSVTDLWAAQNGGDMALNVYDTAGTITLDGRTFQPGGGKVPNGMLQGTLSQINTWLAGMTYTGGSKAGSDTLTVDVWNQAGVEATKTIAVKVAAASTATAPTAPVTTTSTPPVTTTSTAPAILDIGVSEDAWQGDAQFTVSVDGKQVTGPLTVHTLHSSGDAEHFLLTGNWGSGQHDVKISFINDAYGGTATTDRNLYVNSIALDGTTYSGTSATLDYGRHDFTVGGTTAATSAAPDKLVLHLSEDAWNGNAQFQVSVDGKTIDTRETVTALHAAGQSQDLTITGNFGSGPHNVGVTFLNDAYGGTAATDRNLYVNGVTFDSHNYAGATLYSNGTAHFTVSA